MIRTAVVTKEGVKEKLIRGEEVPVFAPELPQPRQGDAMAIG